ncbi:MAG TPA: ATP-binding protein [Bryobacteraceae bacterium]|nr:ATP-binding protein [Bryobacteraceae bacterium]
MQLTANRRAVLEPAVIAVLSVVALVQDFTGLRIPGLPFLYPMRHTVALALLCIAFSLWSTSQSRRLSALRAAKLTLYIALGALIAQALRWMQLLDQYPTHPIAPFANFIHTALPNSICLIGLGAALYALSRATQAAYAAVLSALVGCIVATFAVCALLNEIFKLIPASPAFEGEIAADATACFAIAGIALWRVARTRLSGTGEAFNLRRSVAVAAAGTILSFGIWRVLLHERTAVVDTQTTTTAAAIVRAVRSGLDSRNPIRSDEAAIQAIAPAATNIAGANYQLYLIREGRSIYSFPNPPRRHERTTTAEAPLPELGGMVRLHPGSQFVRRGASWASHIVLAFGFTSCLLLAFSVYLLQVARERLARLEKEIIERRRVEQELNHQAKLLTASNADLEEFARAVSHDLQEPLRNVIGFAELLSRRHSAKLDQDGSEFLGYITDSAQRMSKMIQGLLAYSRTVYARETPERIDLNDTLDWAKSNLALAIEESRATIIADRLPAVKGNALQIGQVMQNLIGNAIKYRRTGVAPVIQIRAASEDANEHRIAISDNGTGIPENLHNHVFGLFKRAHGRDYSGAGVGLAVCKRIVEAHGGRIWVESTPGAGAKFYFTLPAAAEEVHRRAASAPRD